MAKIKIPNVSMGLFVEAAYSWLNRTIEAKDGNLEIRLANRDNKLHVSVGASSSFIEASLNVSDPADIAALSEPIFLDLATLSAYKFDQEGLTMVVPTVEKPDQRIGFSAQGMNFRVPRKEGIFWDRNSVDLRNESIEGVTMPPALFKIFMEQKDLPNSFDVSSLRQLVMEVTPGDSVVVHMYDGFGALFHKLKDSDLKGVPGNYFFQHEFFTPCKKLLGSDSVTFSSNESQCFAQAEMSKLGINYLRWTQPRPSNTVSDIPNGIQIARAAVRGVVALDLGRFGEDLKRAFTFISTSEMSSRSAKVSFVANQYSIKTNKAAGAGDTEVTGEALGPASANASTLITNRCLKEYVEQFDSKSNKALHLEILNGSVYFYQDTEKYFLSYWAPVAQGDAT